MADELPPLKVRDASGSPNFRPVFEVSFSGATLTQISPTGVQVRMDSGAGSSVVYSATGATYVLISGSAPPFVNARILAASTGLQLRDMGATSSAFLYADSLLVTSSRQVLAGKGITGGGNLGADVTLSLATPVAVSSGGTGAGTFTSFGVLFGSGATAIGATVAPASGQILVGSGVNMPPMWFMAGSDGQYVVAQSGAVGGLLWVNTSAAGGGTVVYAPTGGTYLMTTGSSPPFTNARIIDFGTGLTATDVGAANSLSVAINTNVRDKIFTFFGAGACSTAMFISSSRVYIPFSMSPVSAYLAVMVAPVTFGISAQILVYGHPTGPYISLFTSSANIPMLAAAAYSNTGTTTFGNVLTAGSYLSVNFIQVGTVTSPGSNVTLTLVCRSS